MENAMIEPRSQLIAILVPYLTIIFLVINVLKEIFQMVTERANYLTQYENIIDLTVYIFVSICQYFYWFKGEVVNGYFFPYECSSLDESVMLVTEKCSYYEEFLLLMILSLHLNLILQHMIALDVTRKHVIMIRQTIQDTYKFYGILACFILSYFSFLMLT